MGVAQEWLICHRRPMDISGAALVILICLLVVVAVGALVVAVIAVNRWAKANPNPNHSIEDPETGISEEEWMNAMR